LKSLSAEIVDKGRERKKAQLLAIKATKERFSAIRGGVGSGTTTITDSQFEMITANQFSARKAASDSSGSRLNSVLNNLSAALNA
jgi:hypothetical protein